MRYFFSGRLFPCAVLTTLFAVGWIALSVWLPRALAPVALAERCFSLFVGIAVAAGDDPPESRISKLVLLIFLPWTGAILCCFLLRRAPAPSADVAPVAGEGRMKRAFALASACGNPPCRALRADYCAVGEAMRELLLPDLERAERSVWLEYYILARGVFLDEILRILARKAGEGVDVRIIYDDFGCALTLPRRFPEEMAARGIRTAVFRPVRFPTRRAERRDHRKIAVIDGRIAYTGGINLADEYVGEQIRFGHWKDTAVRLEGAPAARFAALFARTWNRLSSDPLGAPGEAEEGTLPCAVFSDGADGARERAGRRAICLLAAEAEKTLYLNTPYLAPDETTVEALCAAASGGVDVRVMIPHIPDKRLPFALTRSYARRLERAGVAVREYTAGFLHAKSAVSDGKYTFVSTYNLDFRSLFLQAECGALIEDAGLAERAERDFLEAWRDGTPVPRAGRAEQLGADILRLFAPLF